MMCDLESQGKKFDIGAADKKKYRFLNRKIDKGFDPEYLKEWERLKLGRPVRTFQEFRYNILRTWTTFIPKGKEKLWKHFQKQY